MNMLAIFTNFSSGQIVAIILLTAFILTVWLVKFFCLSRINIMDLSITIVLFLLCLFVDLNEILIIICIIVNSLDLVYALLDLALYVYMKNEISQKTIDYIKNTEYDFFIQMDKKENILDCSNSLLKLTKLSKKEVLNMKGWKFIFDSFDIKTLNKEEFSLNYVAQFLAEFKECNSKHKKYKFQMEAELQNPNNLDEISIIKYDAIIQPVFCGKMLVARNIFFYQDKVAVIEKLKGIVRSACTDLEDAYLQLDVMMGLSEGIVMYYDFQNKVYVATECMRLYTKTTKKEYTFEELFSHIHPDDVHAYIEQAETVNSMSITKIKYRMQIGDIYYQVEEDSIYMRKDYGLISIIRIAEKSVTQSMPQNAKIQNDLEILNNLAKKDITTTIDKTDDILNIVLGEKKDEED